MERHDMTTVATGPDIKLLDADQVAEVLGCSRRTVSRMAMRGELRAIHIGPRLIRYALSDVAALVTSPNDERSAVTPSVRRGPTSPAYASD
jgi:excisionase family DNA binding protein